MKQNYNSILDEKIYDNKEFEKVTPKNNKTKQVYEKPELTKRSWKGDKNNYYYFIQLALPFAIIMASYFSGNPLLLFSIIPHLIVVILGRRLGGGLSERGLDILIWNMSVLVSTYTHSEMPRLRALKKWLIYVGLMFTFLQSFVSAKGMVLGCIILLLGLLFSFADKESEEIAFTSKITAFILLFSGFITIFYYPVMALLSVTLSLCFFLIYEKWNNYIFSIDIDDE